MAVRHSVSNCYWMPSEDFTEDLRRALTLELFSIADPSAPPQIVEAYLEVDGWVGLPRHYGMRRMGGAYTLDLCEGVAVKFPKVVELYPDQEPNVSKIVHDAAAHPDMTMKAVTGSGKTVMSLAVIQRRGRQALVLVDQENLMVQWVAQCKDKLGLRDDQIGIVQGDRADYHDKPVTIAMVQTLVNRDYPDEFYFDTFGTVVFDEAHTVGAPTFSRALLMFSASLRLGVSATINRKDVLRKLIEYNLGTPRVTVEIEHQPSLLYLINYGGVLSYNANSATVTGRYIEELATDGLRNLVMATAISHLWQTGRKVLVISDRVGQLRCMMALVAHLGVVPPEEQTLYSKQTLVLQYEKDPKPPRRPEGWEKGTEYTPIKLSFVQKTLPKAARAGALDRGSILYATYKVMAKGVDKADLSAGIDITPRAEATQVHGRILRELEEKLVPIWVTVADTNSYRALHQLLGRLSDYEDDNAEPYLWDFARGRKQLKMGQLKRWVKTRIKELRSLKILTNIDGRAMLVMGKSPTEQDALLGSPIEKGALQLPKEKEGD